MTPSQVLAALPWMREQLARYTYRPGWRLSIDPGGFPDGPAVLIIDYPAIDSRNPERELRFTCRRPLTYLWPTDPDRLSPTLRQALYVTFGQEVQRAIFDTEMHESREWLRCDGALFDDPHADPAKLHCPGCGGSGGDRVAGQQHNCPACGEVLR